MKVQVLKTILADQKIVDKSIPHMVRNFIAELFWNRMRRKKGALTKLGQFVGLRVLYKLLVSFLG